MQKLVITGGFRSSQRVVFAKKVFYFPGETFLWYL